MLKGVKKHHVSFVCFFLKMLYKLCKKYHYAFLQWIDLTIF